MNVLLIVKSLDLSSYGGIQSHVWELSQVLVREGHRVSILTGGAIGAGLNVVEKGGRTIIGLPIAPFHRLPVFSDLMNEAYFNRQVLKWLDQHGDEFDVLHLHGRSGLWIPWKRPQWIDRCVWTIHGITLNEWRYNRMPMGIFLHTMLAHWIERKAAKRLKSLIAVSEDIRHQIQELFHPEPGRVHVIPNGIQSQTLVTERESNVICFAGRMVPLKGVRLLPGLLENLDPDVKLVMIGKGPEAARLSREFKRRGLDQRVIWTGQLPQEEVLEWFRKVTLLVVPSFYEPQGRVVLEAMSVGCPVVAGRTGGLAEMIRHGENGLLFTPGDKIGLQEAVQYLMQYPEEVSQIAKSGWLTSRRDYGWEGLVESIYQTYNHNPITPSAHLKQKTMYE